MTMHHSLSGNHGICQNDRALDEASEGACFGRSLTPNGSGTDHGWGGHNLVMGGAVRGGDVMGTMPELVLDSPDAIEDGRIIPSTSVDHYSATLVHWFGLNRAQTAELFPNLSNFSSYDLGFMVQQCFGWSGNTMSSYRKGLSAIIERSSNFTRQRLVHFIIQVRRLLSLMLLLSTTIRLPQYCQQFVLERTAV